ncbi:MAG: hypothetical protein AAGU12_16370, partial [Clostridiales bacterium]
NHHSQKPRLHDGSVSNYGQKAVSNVTLRFLNLCLDKGDTIVMGIIIITNLQDAYGNVVGVIVK